MQDDGGHMGNVLVERRVQLWALVLALVLAGMQAWQLRGKKIDLQSKMDSVVVVETGSGSGTGFFFDDRGCLMTAFHVVDDAAKKRKPIHILLRGDPRKYLATPVAGNAHLDVAILCSTEAWRPGLRIVQTEHVVEGDHVWVIGHPMGRRWNVTDGIVSRMSYKMHHTMQETTIPAINLGFLQIHGLKVKVPVWMPRYDIMISAFISWGNSGGPVLDDNGNVVGMVVEWDNPGVQHPNNMNVATSGTDLLRFIRSTWGK